MCPLSASTSAPSVLTPSTPTSPSPVSGQTEAILKQHKPSYAPVMFQLHKAHVIIKLHNDQACLLNCTFPSIAVHHFPPLPLKAHWAPRTSPITEWCVDNPHKSSNCWALIKLLALHSALSSSLSPLPTPSAPGFSPSHTSTALSP